MNIIDNYALDEACAIISQILNMIILFETKIESVKQKLCGFNDFSVQTAFKEIDFNNKGYLEVEDLREFLNNNIFSRDIQLLFHRHGNVQRLSFLGFLRVIKPHFNKNLAEQIASRGRKKILNPQYRILLEQVFTLTLVMIGQLQALKLQLSNRFCLNPSEIRKLIFKKNVSTNQIQQILIFMKSQQYQVSQKQIIFIEAYLNNKLELYEDLVMYRLFLPTHFKSTYQNNVTKSSKNSILPVQTKTDFLKTKHPNAQFNQNNNYQYPENQPILDNFQFNQSRSLKMKIQSEQKIDFIIIDNMQRQDRQNTPFLDKFLKSSSSQFFRKSPQQNRQNNIKLSEAFSPSKMLKISPKKQNYYSPNKFASPPIPITIKNNGDILESFMKSNRSRQRFQDSLSSSSEQQAFRYV